MTVGEFRKIALSLTEAVEGAHMGHADFRVGGKVFASLLTLDGRSCGMVKLTPEQQQASIADHPRMFAPVNGAWGRKGATLVLLSAASRSVVRGALFSAWLNTAPKRLRRQLDENRDE